MTHENLFVVFDMDDTLYLERDYVRSGLRAVANYVETELNRTGFETIAWQLFENGERSKIIDRTLESLGMVANAGTTSTLVELYRNHRPDIALSSTSLDVLRTIGAASAGIGLITDGRSATQRRKVDSLGLIDFCQHIVFTDELGGEATWKPSAAGFVKMQELFASSGSSLVYVADNPVKDFIAPRQLGWKTIRVRQTGALHRSIHVEPSIDAVHSIGELNELLDDATAAYLR